VSLAGIHDLFDVGSRNSSFLSRVAHIHVCVCYQNDVKVTMAVLCQTVAVAVAVGCE